MHEKRHFLSYRKRRFDAEKSCARMRNMSIRGVAAKWLVTFLRLSPWLRLDQGP